MTLENEKQTDLDIGIGTKEMETLKPGKVKIVGVRTSTIEKDGKQIGIKVICTVKHPDKKETVEISSVKYIGRGDKIKTSGIWLNKDEDGLIRKGSALAVLLSALECISVNSLAEKEVETVSDDGGYLCFKAY